MTVPDEDVTQILDISMQRGSYVSVARLGLRLISLIIEYDKWTIQW